MPKQYEAIRDRFIAQGMNEREAKSRAAAIYNSTHKTAPVTNRPGYAAGGEVRDPSSHRTPSQVKKLDHGYNHRPEVIRRRSEQNKGRALLGLKKGDPRDAGHIKPLDKGGHTTRSNLEPQTRKENRGWRRDWKP
jgi:hypothetical protein